MVLGDDLDEVECKKECIDHQCSKVVANIVFNPRTLVHHRVSALLKVVLFSEFLGFIVISTMCVTICIA